MNQLLIKIALMQKSQATCAKLKVGAVIFDDEDNLISVGCNTSIAGVDCNELFHKNFRINKKQLRKYLPFRIYCEECESTWRRLHHFFSERYEVHAEVNAINDMLQNSLLTEKTNLSLLSTTEPCIQCAKSIIATGCFSKVYYLDDYSKSDGSVHKMFELAGISFEKVEYERSTFDDKL